MEEIFANPSVFYNLVSEFIVFVVIGLVGLVILGWRWLKTKSVPREREMNFDFDFDNRRLIVFSIDQDGVGAKTFTTYVKGLSFSAMNETERAVTKITGEALSHVDGVSYPLFCTVGEKEIELNGENEVLVRKGDKIRIHAPFMDEPKSRKEEQHDPNYFIVNYLPATITINVEGNEQSYTVTKERVREEISAEQDRMAERIGRRARR